MFCFISGFIKENHLQSKQKAGYYVVQTVSINYVYNYQSPIEENICS